MQTRHQSQDGIVVLLFKGAQTFERRTPRFGRRPRALFAPEQVAEQQAGRRSDGCLFGVQLLARLFELTDSREVTRELGGGKCDSVAKGEPRLQRQGPALQFDLQIHCRLVARDEPRDFHHCSLDIGPDGVASAERQLDFGEFQAVKDRLRKPEHVGRVREGKDVGLLYGRARIRFRGRCVA